MCAVTAVWCVLLARGDAEAGNAGGEEPPRGVEARREAEVGMWCPIGLSIITPPLQLPRSRHSLYGVMVNVGYGQMTDVCPLDVGLVNNVTRNMRGLEVGPVNLARTCYGVQAGVFNWSGRVYGVQAGVVNVTGDLHGLQLGVLNFASNGGALIFPIFNIGF
jgi:hypothetical protein